MGLFQAIMKMKQGKEETYSTFKPRRTRLARFTQPDKNGSGLRQALWLVSPAQPSLIDIIHGGILVRKFIFETTPKIPPFIGQSGSATMLFC